jgi:hypothetical protein
MPTAAYDEKVFEEDQQYEDDKRLFVQFFIEPIKNETASEKAGRPIFDEVPCIRIMTPGSRDVMVQKVNESYKRRFPKQWDRFEKQQEEVVDGTPLTQVPWLTVGIIAELKAVNCHTLEQLATMSDTAMSKMMGMMGFRQKAQNFIAAAKETAPFTQMQAKIEERDNEITLLKSQLVEMQAAIGKLQKKE